MSAEIQKKVIADIELQVRRTKLTVSKVLSLYDISRSPFYGWTGGKPTVTPVRRNLLRVLADEEQAVIDFRKHHRDVGYRKLTWLMNDAEVAALSESAVYGVLKKHNLLGPAQPPGAPAASEYQHKPARVHEHWHCDIAYIKVRGVFYFLVIMLDGFSRYILDWELMPDMLGSSVEDFVQQVCEKYPDFTPKLISDNGSQFISRDFKMLLSRLDIQQVLTRRNHPQTNGKIERLNGTIKREAIRVHYPQSFEEARQVISDYVLYYNQRRLHAGIKFLRPADLFHGQAETVLQQRQQRLERARHFRYEENKFNNRRKTTNKSEAQFVRI